MLGHPQGDAAHLPPMNARQTQVFEGLLSIGQERPYAPVGLVEDLRDHLESEFAKSLARWSEPTLWVTKSTVMAVRRCEADFVASRVAGPPSSKHPAAAVGDLAHRGIQLAYTHPGHPVATYIEAAARACRAADAAFAALWDGTDMAEQSDMLMAATSRVTALLDSWPTIRPAWEPRFEEPVQAKVAGVTLAARLDLVLGRPRSTGQQSMVLVDWKSGALRDHHLDEAGYHALVCALSFGVPPFRSVVYSLSSGEYTEPDVSVQVLRRAADVVLEATNAIVDLLTGRREPQAVCGQSWCVPCASSPIAAAA